MKLKKISLLVLVCAIASLGALGCGDKKTEEQAKVEKTSQTKVVEKEESKKIDNPFFTNVFEKAQLGQTFDLGEIFAKASGYTYIAKHGKDEPLTIIEIYKNADKKGDVINFIYMYDNKLKKEVLKTISYHIPDKKKEGSIDNLSDGTLPKYTEYKIHNIGQQEEKVNNVQDIAKFLFN